MEENEEDRINNIFEILKSINNNNKFLEENNINDIFNNLNEEDDTKKKNYFILKYTKTYLINRDPIEELRNKLHFDDFENILNKEEEIDEDEMKNTIKKYLEKDNSFNIDYYLRQIEFYNTEEKINEIINKNTKIYFANEELLENLGMAKAKFKNKEILFGKRKEFIILFSPKENFSILINRAKINNKISIINSIKDNENIKNEIKIKDNNLEENIKDTNQNNNYTLIRVDHELKNDSISNDNKIISELDNKIDNNIIKENDHQNDNNKIDDNINNENEINNNINNVIFNEHKFKEIFNLVVYHQKYINSIDQLSSIYIENLNDFNQIKYLLFNQNNQKSIINCYLVNSEIFENLGKILYYEDIENINNIDDQKEKDFKINELIEKIKKEKEKINALNDNNKLEIIDDYDECYNTIKNDNNIQFMFIDDYFYFTIVNKKIEKQSNISLFKMNDGLFLFFKDKDKIMKVFEMNKYFKVSIDIEKIIDVPKNIVDDLVNLYEQTKNINELIDNEMKENSLSDYYIINTNWLKEYKRHFNYEEIIIKYEQQIYEYEEDDNNLHVNNNNNINSKSTNNGVILGLGSQKKGKNKKRRKKKKNNNNNNILPKYENQSNIQKNNKKPIIKVQYMNTEFNKFLLDEKNILPNYTCYKDSLYPTDFELIEIQTLNNLCNHLKIKLPLEILNQITVKALLGDNKLILQRIQNENLFTVFNSIGDKNYLEYLLIFNDNNLVKKEINIIKRKGIEKYLIDMHLNFYDDSLQYLINESCDNTIGKVYINIKNIKNNNNINFNNNIIINNYNNISNYNYEYSNKIEKILPHRLGLDNIGATCYMNATIQCLCNIIQLENYFLNNLEIFQKNGAKLSKAFSEVMQNLYDTKKNKNSYQPHNFKKTISEMNPLFRGIAANDSKDLILFLYEKIHEELNEPKKYKNKEQNILKELILFREDYYSKNSSIIEKTFYYEQETIYQCTNCGNKVINYNIQNILIFPLEKIRCNLIANTSHGYEYPFIYLEQCFDQISFPELMQGSNNIHCNNCGQESNAYYTTKMNTEPEVMTIILNRGKGNEFNVEFDFPLRIDIKNYINIKNKSTIYDLIGVLVHTGGSDMSGHFFAFCKSNVDHNWYKYNDSFVEKCNDMDYEYDMKHAGLPYVLFYQNVDALNILNNSTDSVSLYFRTSNGIEIYFDTNKNEIFRNVIQQLSYKYSNCNFNFFNVNYYIGTLQGKQMIDYNKTINENNLSNYSYIFIE